MECNEDLFRERWYEKSTFPKQTVRVRLTTCDLYFTILVEVFMNRILAENTCFMNHVE